MVGGEGGVGNEMSGEKPVSGMVTKAVGPDLTKTEDKTDKIAQAPAQLFPCSGPFANPCTFPHKMQGAAASPVCCEDWMRCSKQRLVIVPCKQKEWY